MKQNKRFSADDWLELGLRQLAREGQSGLTIDRLCKKAKRTRGSFYHHFPDHDGFIKALMGKWLAANTADIIDAVESRAENSGRFEVLSDIAIGLDHALEVAVRQFAQSNTIAADYVKLVDQARIAYLEKLYTENEGIAEFLASNIAKIEYAAFVGAQVIWPDAPESDRKFLDVVLRKMVKAMLAQAKNE